MKFSFSIFLLSLAFTNLIHAQQAGRPPTQTLKTERTTPPLRLTPSTPLDINNFVVAGTTARSQMGPFVINIHNSCFDTSLRTVGGRITPTSTIGISLGFTTGGSISVQYPALGATTLAPTNLTNANIIPLAITGVGGARAWALGNLVKIEVPVANVPFNPANPDPRTPQLTGDYRLTQTNGTLLVNGPPVVPVSPLSAQIHIYQALGSYTADIDASFPGYASYCGGAVSPLMFFFDRKRPFFRGSSKIMYGEINTYWPSDKDPGFFLALDRNKNGKIDGAFELFGSSSRFKNGFEALRELDENEDGVIDAADPLFKDLLLYRDWRSKAELTPLQQEVTTVQLNYDPNKIIPVADRAQLRETAEFTFKKGNSIHQGQVIDVWLQSRP